MKVTVPLAGETKPDCVVEYGVAKFALTQSGQRVTLRKDAAGSLVERLSDIEAQACRWVAGVIEEPVFESASLGSGFTLAVEEESNTRLAFAVHIKSESEGEVAFDLDAAWAVRVFVAEGLAQEKAGGIFSAEC